MASFNVTFTGAAGVVGTVTQAAGAGRRNVCTSLSCFAALSTGGISRRAVLRDGATGVGAILWSGFLLPDFAPPIETLLFIIGSANTSMTLEFLVNGDATEIQGVNLGGMTI